MACDHYFFNRPHGPILQCPAEIVSGPKTIELGPHQTAVIIDRPEVITGPNFEKASLHLSISYTERELWN